MSPAAENGDSPAIMADSHPGYPADSPAAGSVTGSGRHARRTPAGRSPEDLDYRLRGLHGESTGDVPAPTEPDRHRRLRHGPVVVKAAVFVAVAALALLLVRAFVIQPFVVSGDAMAPTLQPGDRILVTKSGHFDRSIHSGEIVVIHPARSLPCTVVGGSGGDLVLRVVALPGDTIWSAGDTIFVDGRVLHETGWYDTRSGQVGSTPIRRTALGPGQYFVMADNRADACDSRAFGPVSKSSVLGQGIAIVGRGGHVFFGSL